MICSGGGWWYRFCRQPITTTEYTTTRICHREEIQNRPIQQQQQQRQPPLNYNQTMEICNLKQSPYYQLYGPPPSYDTVVQMINNDCQQPSTSNKLNFVTNIVSTSAQNNDENDEIERL